MNKQEHYIVSIDVGGTFTDVVAMRESDGIVTVAKVPSTPDDPSIGFTNGISALTRDHGIPPENISYIIHGSTVGCNAVVQGKLPKTALLTTEGYRDELELARMVRGKIYDLYFSKPRLLVPRKLRYEVKERLDYKGQVVEPIHEDELEKAIINVRESGAEAVAICFLFSYTNPAHEEKVRDTLQKAFPDCNICISSEVNPTFREYERTCVTVLNAALTKVMARYLRRIDDGLQRLHCPGRLYIMRQDGGVMGNITAQRVPINAVISGPTGGALMAAAISKQSGCSNLISLDVGGTTADACLISNGEIQLTDNWEIGGYPLTIYSIEVNSIGAGGGSIAWIDGGGFLRVGPQSAGAEPGPIAYGLGGTEVTLTDANIALGRLSSGGLLNGAMQLNTDASCKAVDEFSKKLGMGAEQAAEGIIRVAVANMARGIRKISVERGFDLRDFALVPFGGGGPMYGSELARELGIPKVIIPQHPGAASAFGLLTSNLKHVSHRSYVTRLDSIDLAGFERMVGELQTNVLKAMEEEGHQKEEVQFSATVDLRYVGQSYELPVPQSLPITKESVQNSAELFHKVYATRYGHASLDKPVELVNVHVIGMVKLCAPQLEKILAGKGSKHAIVGSHTVVFAGDRIEALVYQRERLGAGDCVKGPAIIKEYDSTTVLWPGDTIYVDEYGSMILTADADK